MDIIGMLGKEENIESFKKNVCSKPEKSEKVKKGPKQCMASFQRTADMTAVFQ